MLPSILMDEHVDCMGTCSELIDSADKNGTFLNLIVPGDETWCLLYDLQLK
jgi:hypothetical protein